MENKSAAPVAQVLVPAVSEIRSLLEASRKKHSKLIRNCCQPIGKSAKSLSAMNRMTASMLHMVKRPYRSFPGR